MQAKNSLLGKATWGHQQANFLDGQQALAEVDALAMRLESEWGVGRLRMLVPPDLRGRFDSQRMKFALSQQRGDLADLKLQCARMASAWKALEAAARAAGATPAPESWECALADGGVMVLVRDALDVGRVRVGKRKNVQIWSLEEVARFIDAQPDAIRGLKAVFRGAVVESVQASQSAAPEPSAGAQADFDDPIPF